MGRFASTAFFGMPRRMCIPNFSPNEWTYSLIGLKPFPPAAEGKRFSAGMYLAFASIAYSDDFEFPWGVGLVTNHSISTTAYSQPNFFRCSAIHFALLLNCSSLMVVP